jgi:hypothetical protein
MGVCLCSSVDFAFDFPAGFATTVSDSSCSTSNDLAVGGLPIDVLSTDVYVG